MPKKITRLALLLLTGLVPACVTNSPLSDVPSTPVIASRQVTLPPLPDSARQPAKPRECSPSCIDNLTSERESSRNTLTRLPQLD